ncbi:hypothetical protein PR048_027877 [Dryococelus australis]|uniref:Retrovirus-related Pol polyprotein from transposon TNT 1-94 n=1 Tax=Dryococelus australis TaxID=614101 RepID=A0ABQ9GHR5_9NEOP|nr:hypothetical protein PR048_027877 [Dryococelus australis]
MKIKEQLTSKFKIKDLHKASYVPGTSIEQASGRNSLSQEQCIENITLKRGEVLKESVPYQSLVGSLMYLAVCTRPDIVHSVNYLSQFKNCYTLEHWEAAKRILRYLQGSKQLKLEFSTNDHTLGIHWAGGGGGGNKDRKSYSGFVFILVGEIIEWESRRKKTVALSSTNAEYMALSAATKEYIFVQAFMGEVLGKISCPTSTYPVFHNRSEHIDIRHHFIRDYQQNQIKVEYCATENMWLMGLGKTKHERFLVGLELK